MQSSLYIASTNAKIVPKLTFIPLLAHSYAMRAQKHNIHMFRKRRKGIHKSHITRPKADGVPSVVVLVAPNTLHNHMAVCLCNNHSSICVKSRKQPGTTPGSILFSVLHRKCSPSCN